MTAIPVTVVTQNATHDDLTDSDYAVAFGVTLEYNNYVSPRQLFSGFLFAYNLCVCRQRSAYVQAKAEPLMLSLARHGRMPTFVVQEINRCGLSTL